MTRTVLWLGLFGIAACSTTEPTARSAASPAGSLASAGRARPAQRAASAAPAPSAAPSAEPAPPPPPQLPAGIVPGAFVSLDVPRDRSVWVIHGEAGVTRVLVYLHGVCGNIHAVEPFGKMLAGYGTLIALKGDRPCEGARGRYRWSGFIPGIQDRIGRAIDAVRAARGGALDPTRRILIGYSQGATRAAALTARYPATYPLLLLAGMPTQPRVSRSGAARAIAVVGGEQEPNGHMRAGVDALTQAGRRAAYFELPGATHGQYGPQGERVLTAALAFLIESESSPADPNHRTPPSAPIHGADAPAAAASAPARASP